ncbi:MAG: prolyl oligopeptidase family serine peptidase [Acidobacteriota bacterium]
MSTASLTRHSTDAPTLGSEWGLHVPAGPPPSNGWPALLFLHGMGECGDELDRVLDLGLPPALARHPERWPFVVVVPQKRDKLVEWTGCAEALDGLLARAANEQPLDPERLSLTGLSQGGHGCWTIASRQPERWAAIAPICGFAQVPLTGWRDMESVEAWEREDDGESVARLSERLRDVPCWAFHGAADDLVPAVLSARLVAEHRRLGGRNGLTVYPGLGHDSWTQAYSEPELAEWLLAARRGD